MIDNTINDDKTIAGGGKDVILAGRYRILRQLGEGGMGSVWLAEDWQLDNRKVAIKMLPTIVVKDKRAYQQLKSEALVSLKLVHPNIVTLRAFEENNGAPFLVMDYIKGQTLSDYLAVKGKLSEKETVALLKPIAAALDYAHSEKVIHRDVKPSNIIIRKDGHPFILDFGIAREIQESMTRVTGRTISGTLLYMSPEQLRGAPPAPAQDVYSFAAMAYECLKGEPPFSRGEIAYQILNEKPNPLTGSSQFIAVIMSGLAKKPEDRPKSCTAIVAIDGLSYIDGSERMDTCPECSQIGGIGMVDTSYSMLWKIVVVAIILGLATVCGWLWRRGGGETIGVVVANKSTISNVTNVLLDVASDASSGSVASKKYVESKMGDVKIITLPGGATMEMIYVSPGSFMKGYSIDDKVPTDEEKVQRRMILSKGFWLGKYEVTQAQWKSVMGNNPSKWKGDNLPVECVSWKDCQLFIQKINTQLDCEARLPTEVEWEYACRAGTKGAFGGNGILDDMGWYLTNSGEQTHPVGRKKANDWGFYDMHGNVWEWCEDMFGVSKVHVRRGGCYGSYEVYCNSARCGRGEADYHNQDTGFRLACSE